MARRGRPPHPDVLTPREWEVLALLRDGLTNEQIAERLSVTVYAAKYHVAEILSKLGVAGRKEAAAWQPEAERQPWWAAALGTLRPITLAKAAVLAGAVAALVGMGVLAWGVMRTSDTGNGSKTAGPTAAADRSPTAVGQPFRYTRGLYVLGSDGSEPQLMATVVGSDNQYALSADGRHVAFVSDKKLYLADTEGSQPPKYLASLQVIGEMSLSSDGGYLVVRSSIDGAEGVYLVSTAAGAVTRVSLGVDSVSSVSLSPTGDFLAFVGRSDTSPPIYVARLDGSERREVGRGHAHLAWSPDGSLLAFAVYCCDNPGLFVTDTQGSVSKLSDSEPLSSPPSLAWSRDGDQLVFATRVSAVGYDVALRVLSLAGREDKFLSMGTNPAWSPDETQIAYVRDGDLFVVDVESGGETKITNTAQPAATRPQWLPDGKRVVFSFSPALAGSVWVMDLESRSRVNLADGAAPVWSPDGGEIAFLGGGSGPGLGGTSDIYMTDSGGTGVRKVSAYGWTDVIMCPGRSHWSWSPDGGYLAYSAQASNRIDFAALSGGDAPPSIANACQPQWSPNGGRIAYTTMTPGDAAIYIRDVAQGGHPSFVAAGQNPAWSPDGERIAFLRDGSLYVIRADGSDERKLAELETLDVYLEEIPRWSPDGAHIAATSTRPGVYPPDILVIDVADGESLRVGSGLGPVWSPDNNRIAYYSWESGEHPKIYIADAKGAVGPVLLTEGSSPDWSPDGRRIAFSQ